MLIVGGLTLLCFADTDIEPQQQGSCDMLPRLAAQGAAADPQDARAAEE